MERRNPFEEMRKVVEGDAETIQRAQEAEAANAALTSQTRKTPKPTKNVPRTEKTSVQPKENGEDWIRTHEEKQEKLADMFRGQHGPDKN